MQFHLSQLETIKVHFNPFNIFSKLILEFVLNPEAEHFLNSLGDDNLGVVSIVGKYRTGKSFFVNRVILDKCNEGFAVGPTIQPCTKVIFKLIIIV